MTIEIETLEMATLDAVSPDAIDLFSNWALPFDSTTVGRAISAVPLRHEGINPEDVALIASRYAARGMREQFRIADVQGLAAVQTRLTALGYTPDQPTLTMVSDIRDWQQKANSWVVQLSDKPSDAWESVYRAADFDPIDGANRIKALTRSNCLTFGWIEDASGPIAAGTASFSRGWLSLHGLRTLQRARGKGCASSLIQALGSKVLSTSLQRCFLQVEEANLNAIGLYRRLGFQTAWRYHYWRKRD